MFPFPRFLVSVCQPTGDNAKWKTHKVMPQRIPFLSSEIVYIIHSQNSTCISCNGTYIYIQRYHNKVSFPTLYWLAVDSRCIQMHSINKWDATHFDISWWFLPFCVEVIIIIYFSICMQVTHCPKQNSSTQLYWCISLMTDIYASEGQVSSSLC